VYNSSGAENITLLVKNTGRKTLTADSTALDVLVDGSYVSSDEFTVAVTDGGPGGTERSPNSRFPGHSRRARSTGLA